MSRPSVLIVFSDEWAAYSSPLLNLLDLLEPDYAVDVVCFDNGRFRVDGLEGARYTLLRVADPDVVNRSLRSIGPGRILRRWVNRNLLYPELIDRYTALKLERLVARLFGRRPDHVIAFDPAAALVCSLLYEHFTYWSLEFSLAPLLDLVPDGRIRQVVIQTPERYRVLFGSERFDVFFVQNAHIFRGTFPRVPGRTLVHFGNASHGHRLLPRALRLLPDHTMTLSGIVPETVRSALRAECLDLLGEGRLLVEERYVPQRDVIDYLRRYSVGLCLYDLDSLRSTLIRRNRYLLDDFLLCPSGKMFNYFAAGLPVVANRIPGLAGVEEYEAGILLSDPTPEAIAQAVRRIEADYDRFVRGAFRAAEAHDFRTLARPFLARLSEEPSLRTASIAREAAARSLRLATSLLTLARGIRPTEREQIEMLARRLEGRPVVAYGAGPLLDFLLAERDLGVLNLVAAADRSPHLRTQGYHGLPVVAPEAIPAHARDVVVTSYEHEDEISTTLARLHGPALKVHVLYPPVRPPYASRRRTVPTPTETR